MITAVFANEFKKSEGGSPARVTKQGDAVQTASSEFRSGGEGSLAPRSAAHRRDFDGAGRSLRALESNAKMFGDLRSAADEDGSGNGTANEIRLPSILPGA